MDALTLDQIDEGRRKILRNAAALLEEASLLLGHGHAARAHALAQLASEECAKLPMLTRAAACLIHGKPFDWGELDKRFRDHKAKIHLLHFQESMDHPLLPESADWELAESRRHETAVVNRLKNDAFYVTVVGDHFQAPWECISAETAKDHLALAKKRYRRFEFFESTMGDDIRRALADPEYEADFEELLQEGSSSPAASHLLLAGPKAGPSTLRVEAVGVCWYTKSDYLRVKSLMEDGQVFSKDYDSWLKGAQSYVEHVQSEGIHVVAALIDPDMFPDWCRARGVRLNGKARTLFASEVAHTCYGRRILRTREKQGQDVP